MDKHYIAYIKTECPFCVQARDELFRQKVNHTIYVMDDNLEALQTLKDFHNHPTVPIILVQDIMAKRTLIGGYTDLKEHFDNAVKDD